MKQIPLGPLMIDITGTELTDLDRERLCHPAVGGIILFARNYACRSNWIASVPISMPCARHACRSASTMKGAGYSVAARLYPPAGDAFLARPGIATRTPKNARAGNGARHRLRAGR